MISRLKSISGSAVCGTILQLLCPQIEFAKHYYSVFFIIILVIISIIFYVIILVIIVVNIRKFECGIGREPDLGNIRELGCY